MDPKGVTRYDIYRIFGCGVDCRVVFHAEPIWLYRLGLSKRVGVFSSMRRQTVLYVAFASVVAIAAGAMVYLIAPDVPLYATTDAMLLLMLALAAEGLTFLLPRSATGSMAFIPYFALALVVPRWTTVVAVALLRVAIEIWSSRPWIKRVFNVASNTIMEATAVLVFLGLGGVGFHSIGDVARLPHVTLVIGWQALAAAVAALTVNSVAVTGVIAISTGRRFRTTWLENHRSTIGIDLLATPLVFIFAWVYAAFGVIATATLWIPILGLRQLQRTNLELERTNQELLELMVKSLEARDPYTSGHSRRVQHYAMTIARAVGLPERVIEEVSRAALLHDVGKIHEKYAAVLTKNDKLSPEEWSLIQEHSEDGAMLVATMSKLRDVVPAIRHHHENWDGTGYPLGLAGELIPVASRIIRFADTIDAMTTERPYRRPLTEIAVRAEIVRCRGTQFDPQFADRLLSSPLWPSLFTSPAASADGNNELRVLPRGSRKRVAGIS
jgi:putative nucleotidyltransferase with HDIG domain